MLLTSQGVLRRGTGCGLQRDPVLCPPTCEAGRLPVPRPERCVSVPGGVTQTTGRCFKHLGLVCSEVRMQTSEAGACRVPHTPWLWQCHSGLCSCFCVPPVSQDSIVLAQGPV